MTRSCSTRPAQPPARSRRHPDLPHARDGSGLGALTALQEALIDRALGWLVPGGRLVFCTCSLLPEEGEGQVRAAQQRHPGLVVERVDLPGVEPGWWGPEGLRLRPDHWPDRGGMDGFFMAVLRQPGETGTGAAAHR